MDDMIGMYVHIRIRLIHAYMYDVIPRVIHPMRSTTDPRESRIQDPILNYGTGVRSLDLSTSEANIDPGYY